MKQLFDIDEIKKTLPLVIESVQHLNDNIAVCCEGKIFFVFEAWCDYEDFITDISREPINIYEAKTLGLISEDEYNKLEREHLKKKAQEVKENHKKRLMFEKSEYERLKTKFEKVN